MKIINLETAKKLKEAGFPQPKKEFGQIWHYDGDQHGIITGVDDEYLCITGGNFQDIQMDKDMTNLFIYAPSATEILREIPGVSLSYDEEIGAFGCGWIESEWPCRMFNINEAELCATVWLDINSK